MNLSNANGIEPAITVGGRLISTAAPPPGLVLRAHLGLLTHKAIEGQIVHTARWPDRGLYECRATITPGGDFLLMFPDGGHYIGKREKVNDMLAYRSTDHGLSWEGPTLAFDIDYNQHGFIPLTPAGSRRIYAFGSQPQWGQWATERGQSENVPIGYRYSDDDGRHWCEARLIRPVNDPDFRGMSVTRMCETDTGTWLLGAHEGDWSYTPLITRQYILRSEDKGATWTLLPNARHGGWCCREYGRMDEGRPIALGNGHIFLMLRTPEGHLWGSWSEDDGKSWSTPEPTSLIHPDAPPMVFHLSDGKTLVALLHNRNSQSTYEGLTSNMQGQKDRSEIWLSLSTDGGHCWSTPRFAFANARSPSFANSWRDYNCSYTDVIADNGTLHLFVPHRWERVLHLTLPEADLVHLPISLD